VSLFVSLWFCVSSAAAIGNAPDFKIPACTTIPRVDPKLQGAIKFGSHSLPKADADWLIPGGVLHLCLECRRT
jgi:hypothetical protein